MAGEQKAARINVSGVVQGVGFRFFVKHSADKFGVTGYVRNLYDGSVEALAEGESSAVNGFIEEVKIGPLYSHVSAAKIEQLKYTGDYNNFRIES